MKLYISKHNRKGINRLQVSDEPDNLKGELVREISVKYPFNPINKKRALDDCKVIAFDNGCNALDIITKDLCVSKGIRRK